MTTLAMQKKQFERLCCTAYHEAGHAVVAFYLGIAFRKRGCSIEADKDSAGRLYHSGEIGGDPSARTSNRMRIGAEKQVMVALAGLESQRIYKPSSVRNYHAAQDYLYAINLMDRFVSSDEELQLWFKLLKVRTLSLVRSHLLWPAITGFSEVLLDKKRLSGTETRTAIAKIFSETSRWTNANEKAPASAES